MKPNRTTGRSTEQAETDEPNDGPDARSVRRRAFLRAAGSGAVLATLAGCTGGSSDAATTTAAEETTTAVETTTASTTTEEATETTEETTETTAQPESITVTDTYGRKVELPYPVESMAVINPATYWAIRLLGVQDRVVGVNKGDLLEAFPKILKGNPGVGWYRDPNVEKIAELEADVLITHYHGPNSKTELDKIQKKLSPFGTKVVGIDVTGMNLEETRILGKMVGKEDAIEPFFEWREEQLQRVKDRVAEIPDDEKVSVYFEAESTMWKAKHELPVELAGGVNVMNDVAPDAIAKGREVEVDPESIMKADPDYVLLEDVPNPHRATGYHATDTAEAEKMLSQFLNRPGVDSLSAANDDEVHVLDYKMTSGEKSWLGVVYLAKLFYPDRFSDLDPAAIHEEYYRKWQDNEFQGTYLYPTL